MFHMLLALGVLAAWGLPLAAAAAGLTLLVKGTLRALGAGLLCAAGGILLFLTFF